MTNSFYRNYADSGFFPKQVVAGFFEGTKAFITCKDKQEKWIGIGVFKRLVGYAPHEQRSSEIKLKKIINRATCIYDNEPTEGFKIVAFNTDCYDIALQDNEDVILEDPRGFSIAITKTNFYDILFDNKANIKDGVLAGQYVYGFPSYGSRFALVPINSKLYIDNIEKCKAYYSELDNTKFLTKSKLQVGHVYTGSSSFSGKYMYLGTKNIYSRNYTEKCICAAISQQKTSETLSISKNGCIDIDSYNKNCYTYNRVRKDIMLFYRLDHKGKHSMFVELNSITRKLVAEDTNIDLSKYTFSFIDTVPATYENIKKYVDSSIRYNQIDVSYFTPESTKQCICLANKELFKILFDYSTKETKYKNFNHILSFIPGYESVFYSINKFASTVDAIKFRNHNYKFSGMCIESETAFNITSNSKCYSYSVTLESDAYRKDRYYYHSRFDGKALVDNEKISADELYDKIQPMSLNLKTVDGVDVNGLDRMRTTAEVIYDL